MKKSRFAESQIVAVLKEGDNPILDPTQVRTALAPELERRLAVFGRQALLVA